MYKNDRYVAWYVEVLGIVLLWLEEKNRNLQEYDLLKRSRVVICKGKPSVQAAEHQAFSSNRGVFSRHIYNPLQKDSFSGKID